VAGKKRKSLPASDREMLPGAKSHGRVDPDERIEVTVMVRPRTPPNAAAAHAEEAMAAGAQLPEHRRYLTREQLADQRGADPADFDKIEQFAHEHNLTVTMTSVPQRLIKLSGTLADLTAAFKATVKQYKEGRLTFRGRTGTLSVPEDLADVIVGVYGFDTRPAARPHCRILGRPGGAGARGRKAVGAAGKKKPKASPAAAAPPAAAGLKPFTAPEVARLYSFPTGLDGSGQCIGLIELNTPNQNNELGTGFTADDLKTYFKKLNLPMPTVTAVGVDGGANLPNVNRNADGEVMLDIEVAGAVAPGAQIAVYFAPNTGRGFIDAVSAAVHDTVRKPSVVSISWGGPEDPPFTTKQLRDGLALVLQDAAALGVTVCCASGDNGSSDLPLEDEFGSPLRDGKPHVDFPASSPFALACGGTTLVGTGATVSSEVVWNEGDPEGPNKPSGSGGGGVSNVFTRPTYQAAAHVPKSPKNKVGRGVPDVGGNADSATGYLCKVAGAPRLVPIGGTSAVAPLWAGLVALINQRLANLGKPPAGFINPILYNTPGAFRDVTQGTNDIDGTLNKYSAVTGWDPCTGLGSPDGTKVMAALGG
jgi:kumamolisin